MGNQKSPIIKDRREDKKALAFVQRYHDGSYQIFNPRTEHYSYRKLKEMGYGCDAKVLYQGNLYRLHEHHSTLASGAPHVYTGPDSIKHYDDRIEDMLVDQVRLIPQKGSYTESIVFQISELDSAGVAPIPDMEAEGFVSVPEAAETFGWDQKKVRRMLRQKRIIGVRYGKEWLVKVN